MAMAEGGGVGLPIVVVVVAVPLVRGIGESNTVVSLHALHTSIAVNPGA